MEEASEDEHELTDSVELISDGENLLVLGEDRRSVEGFLRSKGLLEQARNLARHQLVPALRSSADALKTVSDAVAESSLWLKITPETAEAIKEHGLTDSGVPGIAWAMAGKRGNIKEWLQVDTTTRAQAANPGVLSGAAGLLAQAARQQEAAQLRDLLGSLDQKLDLVLRGQQDDILGDLDGIERQIRVIRQRVNTEGDIDELTWSTLFGTSVGLRQIQAKALRKLQGIAADLEDQKRFGDLNKRLQEAKGEVHQWLSVVSRCVIALDELAVLELDYCAVLEPNKLDTRRATLDHERQDDRLELERGIAVLLQRMDEAAVAANQNKLLHVRGVPMALASIEEARTLVQRVYGAFGIDLEWESVDPVQLRIALLQVRQWKNGMKEGGSLALEKGKPVAGAAATAVAGAALTALAKGRFKPRG